MTTYRDIFEVEQAILKKCGTKHWPLLKGLDRNLAKIKEPIASVRHRLETPESIKAFQKAINKLRSDNAGEEQDVLDTKLKALRDEHKQAQKDSLDLQALELEILSDEIEIDWAPIPESYFHHKNELRIDVDAFHLFQRVGMLYDDEAASKNKPKLKSVKGK